MFRIWIFVQQISELILNVEEKRIDKNMLLFILTLMFILLSSFSCFLRIISNFKIPIKIRMWFKVIQQTKSAIFLFSFFLQGLLKRLKCVNIFSDGDMEIYSQWKMRDVFATFEISNGNAHNSTFLWKLFEN